MNQNNLQQNMDNKIKTNPHFDFIKSDTELEDELRATLIQMKNFRSGFSPVVIRIITNHLIPIDK